MLRLPSPHVLMLFQSLTGRLKTQQRRSCIWIRRKFQSLTGRLKTVLVDGTPDEVAPRFNPSQVG